MKQTLETVVGAAPTGNRNAAALADLLRRHRAELPGDLIDQWAPVLAAAAGWRALDRHGVKQWVEDASTTLTAGWGPGEGLYIAYRDERGEPVTYGAGRAAFSRVRLFPPDGDRKYLQPSRSGNRLYRPVTLEGRGVLELARERGYLIVTEGEIDAQWATFLGIPTVSLTGVDSWLQAPRGRGRGPDGEPVATKGESSPIDDLAIVPWCELRVYVVFDSDTHKKKGVKAARRRFAKHIAETYGAQVLEGDLPKGREKVGLGDWLCGLHRDGANIAGEVAKLQASARAAIESRLPGRRPGAQPRPLTLPDGRTLPDVTQVDDAELAALLAGLEIEAQDSDPNQPRDAAIDALKGEREHRAVAALYGLDLRGCPYRLRRDGVELVKGKQAESLTARAIWVDRTGIDLATKTRMALLKWLDDGLDVRERWVHLTSLTHSRDLMGEGARRLELDALPVSEGNARAVSRWLTDSTGWLVEGRRDSLLSSRPGWVETPDGWRYVRVGGGEVYFTGTATPPRGSADAWCLGLDALLTMRGDRLWQALAVIGLCAAAPVVRFVSGGMQNPVICIAAPSSTGKTSLAALALAIYGKVREATLQSMESTPKGLEAQALTVQDRVFCIDDAQTRDLKTVQNWVYFLGNGQTRSRAKRTGDLMGGELWRGVGLYLAEYSLADKFAGGANLRTIEFTTAPLDSREQSQEIQRIAYANEGALAEALYEAIGDPEALGAAVTERAAMLGSTLGGSVKRDDLRIIALACVGLELLQEVTGRKLDADGLAVWLGAHIGEVRKNTTDASTQAWDDLMALIGGATWKPDLENMSVTRETWEVGGTILAWKNAQHIDINPSHREVRSLLDAHGGLNAHIQAWGRAGLIVKSEKGRRLKVQRRGNDGHQLWVVRLPGGAVTTRVTTETDDPGF